MCTQPTRTRETDQLKSDNKFAYSNHRSSNRSWHTYSVKCRIYPKYKTHTSHTRAHGKKNTRKMHHNRNTITHTHSQLCSVTQQQYQTFSVNYCSTVLTLIIARTQTLLTYTQTCDTHSCMLKV